MSLTRFHRSIVVGSAFAWLLLGMHQPTVHEVLDHGWRPHASVLVAVVVLAALALGGLVALLRASPRT
jgi:hypothetical protein